MSTIKSEFARYQRDIAQAAIHRAAYQVHRADACKLQKMRLPDLAARSISREFQALASLLLVVGQAKTD